MAKTIAFIGGEFHGEAKEFFGELKTFLTVGNPPRYIGNNNYDPDIVVHEQYVLRRDEGGKPYYVHHSLLTNTMQYKDGQGIEELKKLQFETPNAARIRREMEIKIHGNLYHEVLTAEKRLLQTCIAKHDFLDEYGVETPRIDNLILLEDSAWKDLKKAQRALADYKGEKPYLKSVAKV